MVFVDGQAAPFGEERVKELTSRLEGFVNKALPMRKRPGGGLKQGTKRFSPQRTQRVTEERLRNSCPLCLSVFSVV
jgi:hypothetical protein